jgi:peptide/nickel transport system permease protein
MQRYIAARLLASLVSLFGLSILVFFFLSVVPGDAALIALGPEAASSPEQVAEYRRQVGLDDPAPVQYARWIGNLLQGDLGKSLVTARTVTSELQGRATTTIELAVIALTFSLILGLALGTFSAVKHGTAADQVVRVVSVLGLAVPNFWLGTIVIVYGAIWFGWFPPVGRVDIWRDPVRNLQQMVVPGAVLGVALAASLTRLTRSTVLEAIREDYVRTARAKGLTGRTVLLRHALRPSLVPIVTLFSLQVGAVLAGSVVIETVFNLPGLGRLLVDSISRKDYTVVQSLVFIFGVMIVAINLITDVLYTFIDPRVKLGR